MTIDIEEIRLLQTLLVSQPPEYSEDPKAQRRVGQVIARTAGAASPWPLTWPLRN